MSCCALISGVRMVDPVRSCDALVDLYIRDGRLRSRPERLPERTPCFDGRHLCALPGLIDVHVHFRDPGNSQAENLQSGARAAAAGGFTHVVTMPNTVPACDSPELIRRQRSAALPVRILPAACLTRGRAGTAVADMESAAAAGAVAFTDDGGMVTDEAVMAAAMRAAGALGLPIMDHAVDPRLMGRGVIRDCELARRLGLPIMPPEAEVDAVRRDIRLCRETGCRTHIQHVSCAGALEAIRAAQREGLPVTCEASPHHLCLAAEEIPGDDGNFRMNPPLGNRDDRAALRAAVLDGTAAILATDHAPHTPESKSRGFLAAPFGVIGLETAIRASYGALVVEAGMRLLDWVACWTLHPARLIGLPPPTLAPAESPANLTLVDLDTPWTVRPDAFLSQSRNCPLAGRTLRGRALLTLCEGTLTWQAPDWPQRALPFA